MFVQQRGVGQGLPRIVSIATVFLTGCSGSPTVSTSGADDGVESSGPGSAASTGATTAETSTGTGVPGDLTGSETTEGSVPGPPIPEILPRTRRSINDGWRFTLGDPVDADGLAYDEVREWVLPSGNAFLGTPGAGAERPEGNLGDGLSYVQAAFDDSGWEAISLPHDHAIAGPYTNQISSSMGRLPSMGVSWYRKTLAIDGAHGLLSPNESVFLDIDGAMSYGMVWVNGQFVGGRPYGYASYRLDLTDHVVPGQDNIIAIRLDNPVPPDAVWDSGSSRWYPGAGIYRNVWIVTTDAVHVAHWGTYVTTPAVSVSEASVDVEVTLDNDSDGPATVTLSTDIYEVDAAGIRSMVPVASLRPGELVVPPDSTATSTLSGTIPEPRLWGPPPSQSPNLYEAVTLVERDGTVVDVVETRFGVRTLGFDPNQGFLINGERLKLEGVCLHHDLGPLGAAFNYRARERQLEIMADMGANAIRTAHNPFEPELLEITDRMGIVVMDEAFDVWAEGKAELDHHVFFEDWHEQDLRTMLRRDRNHPSVVMWSIGNELVEQFDATAGPAIGAELTAIAHDEDPTRPTVAGMNAAAPGEPFVAPIDAVGLNYQGTGVRGGPPQYPAFHTAHPDKFIVGTETVSTFSTRGTYLFPVATGRGEPAIGSAGIDNANGIISSYDLYYADWSASPDAEFESQDLYPFVGGEFVWTGFDYLGEPTPLDAVASSSYFGIVDLAGLRKDRFYLYQARWRDELPMAHILPHWTWPERNGQVTPVHVYTSGDSAELFVNDESQGLQTKGDFDYRLRWDDVIYQPGTLRVVAYRDGVEWATDTVETAGVASGLALQPDRSMIDADGDDVSFVTLTVRDDAGQPVPRASNLVTFEVSGAGELVATANGDPTNDVVFSSAQRNAFSGMAIAIVRAAPGMVGEVTVSATAPGLAGATVTITTR